MASVFRFTTAKFDLALEEPNPINPIPGASLLAWLKKEAGEGLEITDPDAEDWGWFCYVNWKGRRYLLGSSASVEQDGEPEWVLQVVKQRTFIEKLLGRHAMQENDECAAYLRAMLEREPSFHSVAADPEP